MANSHAMWLLLLVLLAMRPAVAAEPAGPVAVQAAEADMRLPAELRASMPARALDQRVPAMERVQVLLDFMIGDDGLALRYREQPTLSIADSYRSREVNCLSFTLMFVAMARAAGIRAYAQASDEVLVVRVLDNALYRTTHMNAGVEIGGAVYSVDVGWADVLAGREPKRISDVRSIALLHNNRAVERMLGGDLAAAASDSAAALALDPANPALWSNAGVVQARRGDFAAAERNYLQALQLKRSHIGALGNLVGLYRKRADAARAGAYATRLERAQAADPFSQFLLAQQEAAKGAFERAIVHYRKAIRLLPAEPAFHRALAVAYLRKGDAMAWQRTLERAQALEDAREKRRGIRLAGAGPG